MPFTEDHFIRLRPILYHLTNRNNIEEIRRLRALQSAAFLMQRANDRSFLTLKRNHLVEIEISSSTIRLRDQQPLYAGNIQLEGGWSFEDFIQSLNERVFFWPGTQSGPISYGVRHFQRYVDERPVILRVSTADLLNDNQDTSPQYCRYNSGSPRCSGGMRSPRGPETFVNSATADYLPSQVVEVTFRNQAVLPESVELSESIWGPWSPL